MRGDLLVCEAAAAQFGDVECDVVRQESRLAEARALAAASAARVRFEISRRSNCAKATCTVTIISPTGVMKVDGAVDRDERPSLRLCVVEQAKEVASPRLRVDLLLALSLCPAECPVGRAKDVHLPGNHRERPLG
jgi:hypothetical protein